METSNRNVAIRRETGGTKSPWGTTARRTHKRGFNPTGSSRTGQSFTPDCEKLGGGQARAHRTGDRYPRLNVRNPIGTSQKADAGIRPRGPPYRPNQLVKVDPNLLRDAREASGFTQAKASEDSGVSLSKIRRYEQGIARPTGATVRKLALTYGKPLSWFNLDASDNPPPVENPLPWTRRCAPTCLRGPTSLLSQ